VLNFPSSLDALIAARVTDDTNPRKDDGVSIDVSGGGISGRRSKIRPLFPRRHFARIYAVTNSSARRMLGRFVTPDPMTEDAHSTQGSNRYSYVGNSPVNFTDPSGYCFIGCFWQKL
jgi:hypothetical protein